MSKPIYDDRCEELAVYFLDLEGLNTEPFVVDLASRIQAAVEDFFAEINSDADKDD